MTERVGAWRDGGRFEDVEGHRIFVRERAGDGPVLLLLHGFPSSSYDFRGLLDRLPPATPFLTFDFLGFGLSDKPADHTYSLMDQAALAEELVRRAGGPPVRIVAHDMGTSVATELFARELEGKGTLACDRALLFNGSILLHLATPTAGQKLLRSRLGPVFSRLNTRRTFTRQFGRIFSSDHPLSREEGEDQWALFAGGGGKAAAPRTIAYMGERERYSERWHGAFARWPGDLRLAWGLQDPVANPHVLRGLQELRPGVAVTELPELGHYPQLEDPARMARIVAEAMLDGAQRA